MVKLGVGILIMALVLGVAAVGALRVEPATWSRYRRL
jgi:hypothetical protein